MGRGRGCCLGAVGGLTNHSKTCRTGTAENQSQRQSKPKTTRQHNTRQDTVLSLALSFQLSRKVANTQCASVRLYVYVLAENS